LHFCALDGSIPAALLFWFQTIASANPIRARTIVMELVFGCMLTGRGHVTQAISTISPRRGWRVIRTLQGYRISDLSEDFGEVFVLPSGPGQSHMEFTVVEGWHRFLEEWRYQLGSRVPERRGTRVGTFLCS
jgi:hypothetical protein